MAIQYLGALPEPQPRDHSTQVGFLPAAVLGAAAGALAGMSAEKRQPGDLKFFMVIGAGVGVAMNFWLRKKGDESRVGAGPLLVAQFPKADPRFWMGPTQAEVSALRDTRSQCPGPAPGTPLWNKYHGADDDPQWWKDALAKGRFVNDTCAQERFDRNKRESQAEWLEDPYKEMIPGNGLLPDRMYVRQDGAIVDDSGSVIGRLRSRSLI